MTTQRRNSPEAGHTLILSVFLVLVLLALGFSVLSSVTSAKQAVSSSRQGMRQLHLAEAALDAALLNLRTGGNGNVASSATPVEFGGGEFWSETTDHADGTHTVIAVGRFGSRVRVIKGRIRSSPQVFHHAVFAGNSSGDPDYVLELGGIGAQGDLINGDIYSGGDIEVVDDAAFTGDARAHGDIVGATGDSNVTQPPFDFSSVDFSDPSVVDVAGEFAASGYAALDAEAGGTADQVAETNPAHIFRRNPDDRAGENSSTVKDDYFLEDPFEDVEWIDPDGSGVDSQPISIDDGTGTTRRVYYIDGNLWIHNHPYGSFMFETAAGTGIQVTFIVRGNIIFSDDVRMQDPAMDGVAFVALADPNVADSGNVILGDPVYGTLRELQSFLYAENDFLDVNLDESGAKAVRILGSMAAGNHVSIDRTYGPGIDDHSKLTVDWDARLTTGLSLPLISTGLPPRTFGVEAWAERSPGSR